MKKKFFIPFTESYRVKVIEKPTRGRSKVRQTFDCHTFGAAEFIANAQIMQLMEEHNRPLEDFYAYTNTNVQGASLRVINEDKTETFYYVELHRI